MGQTNFNKYVRVTFDRNVNSLNFDANLRAFSLVITQRDHYSGPLYSKTILPISIEYAVDTLTAVILKFSDSSSFRKAEGAVTLKYNSIIGNLYGVNQTDRLNSFNLDFIPHDLDMYQNPYAAETILINNASTSSTLLTPITVHNASIEADSIIVGNLSSSSFIVTQIGTIQP